MLWQQFRYNLGKLVADLGCLAPLPEVDNGFLLESIFTNKNH